MFSFGDSAEEFHPLDYGFHLCPWPQGLTPLQRFPRSGCVRFIVVADGELTGFGIERLWVSSRLQCDRLGFLLRERDPAQLQAVIEINSQPQIGREFLLR